jgi:hypothetical protein
MYIIFMGWKIYGFNFEFSLLSFLTLCLTFAVAFTNSVETKRVQVKYSQQRPFHV